MSGPLLRPDPSLRRWAAGRVLVGGAPLRLVRLTPCDARLVDTWLGGEPVSADPAHRALAARLVRAGLAHPDHDTTRFDRSDVTVVVPVRDQAATLAGLVPALGGVRRVIVVDDGSRPPLGVATARHRRPRGAGAARNTGWRLATTELVAFLDADVRPTAGWLEALLPYFDDPEVVAVAPRVRSRSGPSGLDRYEQRRSSLDLGAVPAVVRPGGRVSYVPSAAIVVRRSALRAHGGFDERLRFGEDVDLVWRLAAAGGQVRYQPESIVEHLPRADWPAFVRQRFKYGRSAAPLSVLHGDAVSPVRMSGWSAVVWAALAAGLPRTALAVAAGTAALLPRTLGPVGVPTTESLRLALSGHLGAGRLFADAVTRAWWPLAVPLLLTFPRGRLLLALAVGRHVRDWYADRPPVSLPTWLAVRTLDDLAYGAGLWWGAYQHATVRPLLPDFTDWPGPEGIQHWSTDQP